RVSSLSSPLSPQADSSRPNASRCGAASQHAAPANSSSCQITPKSSQDEAISSKVCATACAARASSQTRRLGEGQTARYEEGETGRLGDEETLTSRFRPMSPA